MNHNVKLSEFNFQAIFLIEINIYVCLKKLEHSIYSRRIVFLFPKLQILFWLFMFLISFPILTCLTTWYLCFTKEWSRIQKNILWQCGKMHTSRTKKIGHLKCNSVCSILGALWKRRVMCALEFIHTHYSLFTSNHHCFKDNYYSTLEGKQHKHFGNCLFSSCKGINVRSCASRRAKKTEKRLK